tara:strand:- start:3942 stop:4841 length:900 start_codon:yes stop_codon:yes gene_type:complete
MKKKVKKYNIGGALLSAIPGVIQTGVGIGQLRRGARDLAQIDSLEAGMIRSEASRKRIAQQQTDITKGIENISRNLATGTEALARRGNRALIGGVQGLQAAADKATQSYLDKYGASSAARDQQLDRADFGESARRIQRQRGIAQQQRDAGFQNIGMGFDLAGKGLAKGLAKPKDTQNVKNQLKYNTLIDDDFIETDLEEDELELLEEGDDLTAYQKRLKRLTRPAEAEEGAKVKKTPGKFSHKKNPIDIVQEGDKIGEMTGGEYIFNPDQAKQLQSLSKKGNTPLHKFVNKMLNKSQFK